MTSSSKTPDELEYSVQLHLYSSCYSRQVADLRKEIFDRCQAHDPVKKPDVLKRHINKVISFMFEVWLRDPKLLVHVSMDNNDYGIKKKYNKRGITRNTKDVVNKLIAIGLLDWHPGMPPEKNFTFGKSFWRRIWPSEELISLFKKASVHHLDFLPYDLDDETIWQSIKVPVKPKKAQKKKPKKKKKFDTIPVDYSDTPAIRAMRLVMVCYNELLRTTHIDIASAEKPYTSVFDRFGKEIKVWHTPHSFMTRKFTGSPYFKTGGRIYGGWWERCHSEYRKDIYINGNPTVEVDFSATHPILCYAKEGVNWFEFSGGRDVYDVEVPELDQAEGDYSTFKRFLIKILMLNSLNAASEEDAFDSTRWKITQEDYSPESKIKRPPESVLPALDYAFFRSILERIKQRHHLIRDYFLSNIAGELQFIDSQITINLIEHFTFRHIPILTVHDSYIVETKYGQDLINAMQSSFMQEVEFMQAKRANPDLRIKRSRFLHKLSAGSYNHSVSSEFADTYTAEELYHDAHTDAVEYDNPVEGYSGGRTKLKQIGHNAQMKASDNQWSVWNRDVVNINPAQKLKPTKRYEMSLKLHQQWLQQPQEISDSEEVAEIYENLFSSINKDLYYGWLNDTYDNGNAESDEELRNTSADSQPPILDSSHPDSFMTRYQDV
jgi:hypothetical protein